jgi:sporulation protein YlmC with PRC-barrel domain
MNKAVFFTAALLLMPLPAMSQHAQQSQDQSQKSQDQSQNRQPNATNRESERSGGEDMLDRLARSDLRDRLSAAVQRIEGACSDDIERFCSDVTPGGGRIASCVDAYSDQLSRSCQSALSRAVNRVQRAVETMAGSCLSAVQQQCGNAGNVKQCLQQKNSSLPQSCQTIIAAVQEGRQALAERLQEQSEEAQAQAGQEQGEPQQAAQAQGGEQGLGHLRGMPVFSSDGRNLGQIIKVERGPDGKIQSVQIEAGRMLGLGEKTVTIPGNKIEQLADRIRVTMSSDQVRNLPETKGQGGGAQR